MKEYHYTSERNVCILLSLLKANGIRKVIMCPGTTNYTLVASIQSDPWFETYSSVDERSAAYIACGMAAESGEPVMLTCTGSTASRNFYPGLTEAYYRKLPILAVTSHQGTDRIGHLIPQNIDRRNIPEDIANISVELPVVKDERDASYVIMQVNKALLELKRNGGGPAHINIFTTYSKDFSVEELPQVRSIQRFCAWETLPDLPKGNIAVFVGSHLHFTDKQTKAIDRFCATHDAIVICDHTSGYYGKYKLLPTLLQLEKQQDTPWPHFDVLIHIGEVSAASFSGNIPAKEIWRVSEDGQLRDPYKKLRFVFQMPEVVFFTHYGHDGVNRHENIDKYTEIFKQAYIALPELPFSNFWIASKLSSCLPQGSLFHMSASNTRRCWNSFPLPQGVTSQSNVGCCGIDGATSSIIGASLVSKDRLCYLATGDLAFFYDLNSLGNRHIMNNLRILLVNNGLGAEFRLSVNYSYVLGEEASPYIAAQGHYANKSTNLVKHYAEDLGFEYLAASSKEEFEKCYQRFVTPQITDKPMIFECFTNETDENSALEAILYSDSKRKMAKQVKEMLGEQNIKKIKSIFGK